MMHLYDDNELKIRKREQMYGNMYLITELYIARQLNGNIIKTCLDDLQQEINDQNIEIMCYMMNKLMNDLSKQAKLELKEDVKKKSNKVINLDYADKICQNLFEHRKSEQLESRIRFKIQDLIDAYNRDWRFVISEAKSRAQDNEGFKQIYVPKDQILTEDQVFHHGSSRFGKDDKGKKR